MIHDTPKPTKGWSWGPANILKPLPKFAARLGAMFSAMAVAGIAVTYMMETSPEWAKAMAIFGVVGAGLSSLFAKK